MIRHTFELHRGRLCAPHELDERFARAWRLLAGEELELQAGLTLAQETLLFDPYRVEARLRLAQHFARVGEAALALRQLEVCLDMEQPSLNELLADPVLTRGPAADAIAEGLRLLENERPQRVRIKDLCVAEIEPNQDELDGVISWPPAAQPAMTAAYRRFLEHVARAEHHALDDWDTSVEEIEEEVERLASPCALTAVLQRPFCYLGRVHQLLRDIAPYVSDVRLLLYAQGEPLDEFWIVDGVLYLRRHEEAGGDAFDTLARCNLLWPLHVHAPTDVALSEFLAEELFCVAQSAIEHLEQTSQADLVSPSFFAQRASEALHYLSTMGHDTDVLAKRLAARHMISGP